MNAHLILSYLRDIAANNNREWFHAHRDAYDRAHAEFLNAVEQLIRQLSIFDPSVAHLTAKDCVYRFYRDTRFSNDKSPYKRHFGAYISAKGKKSLHGGYYLHLQPGNCFIATGSYYLPNNILFSCRNEIMANEEQWLSAVENGRFVRAYGYVGKGTWGDGEYGTTDEPEEMSPKGFGLSFLKKAPKGFPADYQYLDYLRMKDYCCWHRYDEDFFQSDRWLPEVCKLFKTAKPMMDFMNGVIDDYE